MPPRNPKKKLGFAALGRWSTAGFACGSGLATFVPKAAGWQLAAIGEVETPVLTAVRLP
jgi:hypothetical protein